MTLKIHTQYALKWLVVFTLLINHLMATAQGTPTIFDCLGGQPICEQLYKEEFIPRGAGNFTGEINSNFSCLIDDNSALWYTFIAGQSGNLGFQITPTSATDDLNWGLFDITNNNCRDIFSKPPMLISCNSSSGDSCNGRTGADNSSTATSQEGNCNMINPNNSLITTAWNAFIPVQANNIYALMIRDVSGTSSGFEIDFGLSDIIMLNDNKNPEIKLIEPDVGIGCIPNKIFVQFSENIRCNSFSRSNFTLTDATGRSYGVDLDSGSCNLNGEYDRSYVLALLEPLPVGNTYTIEIQPSENQPIVDLCGNFFAPFSYTFDITTDQLSDIQLPSDTSSCEDLIILDVFDVDATDYRWSDGSTSPNIEVSSDGLYSVTVSNPCSRVETSINVSFAEDTEITFSLGADTLLCNNEVLLLSTNLLPANYKYSWNDGSTASTRLVSTAGIYTLEVSNACGRASSSSIKVDYLNIDLALPSDTAFCSDSTIIIDAIHPNGIIYQWSSGETTPAIEISQEGIYNIEVSNQCETIVREINIEEIDCQNCNIYIPNVFSPNSNGDNKKLEIDASCRLISFHLQVYNRWGNLVFESMDQSNAWAGDTPKGSKSDLGIYIYHLEYSYRKDSEVRTEQIQGDVLLIN